MLISICSAALLVMAGIALLNAWSFTRLQPAHPNPVQHVSLLVPARDEAAHIEACVRSLLAQDYPHFNLLVLDDHSSDGTAALALQAGGGDPRLRVLPGKALPPGWLGKAWACQQLAEQAPGELLLFSDADVVWQPSALGAILAAVQHSQADMFTVFPTQQTFSWPERLVVPLMMLALLAYLPELATRRLPFASMSAANGQCLVFTQQAYRRMGGHAAVRQAIIEDVALARLARRLGLRLGMALGAGELHCRMYQGWDDVRRGFGKNILAGHGGQPVFLVLSTLFHWLVFLGPWLWLALGWLPPGGAGWPWAPLALIALGIAVRALTARLSCQRLRDALLLPVSVLLMSAVALQALRWHFSGGLQWKGRWLVQDQ